jgi:hypothetical protein
MWAEMVLCNGKVITMNPSQPSAQAVAAKNGEIVAVGLDAEIKPLIGKKTKTIDLRGRTVLPGLIDTHIHVAGLGRSLAPINLRDVNSIEELQKKLEEQVQKLPKGRWITGRGWDQDRLVEKRYPTRWDLDESSHDNPVVFTRVCGHMCVANSKALEMANIAGQTVPPLWGQIDKDAETGEPTGILRESAMNLVWDLVSPPSEEALVEACGSACRKAAKAGLTSVHWIVESADEMRAINELRRRDELFVRVYILVPSELLEQVAGLGLCTGFGDDFVRIGSLKVFADGSLGARTAALREPYYDEPATKGLMHYSQEELNALVLQAHTAELQLAMHAIGDKAIDMVLTALENALTKVPRKDHRHRIEHASVLDEDLISRMKRANVIASVQPHFIVSDFWVVDRVGVERARWVYPFRILITEGIKVTGGSDFPVEPMDPLLGMWAAVAERSFPEERLTVDEALQLYTIDAAFASFEESTKGSIESGKLADLVILSRDPHEVSPENIKDIEVEMTILGGKVVYAK